MESVDAWIDGLSREPKTTDWDYVGFYIVGILKPDAPGEYEAVVSECWMKFNEERSKWLGAVYGRFLLVHYPETVTGKIVYYPYYSVSQSLPPDLYKSGVVNVEDFQGSWGDVPDDAVWQSVTVSKPYYFSEYGANYTQGLYDLRRDAAAEVAALVADGLLVDH